MATSDNVHNLESPDRADGYADDPTIALPTHADMTTHNRRPSHDRQLAPCTELTLDEARQVLAAAEQRAIDIDQPENIAVVDAGGHLISHIRMDGAWCGGITISIDKAWTARAFDAATRDLAANTQPGGQFYGLQSTNNGRVVLAAGGILLKKGETIVGAIGVSGGDGTQDQSVAEAGAAALG